MIAITLRKRRISCVTLLSRLLVSLVAGSMAACVTIQPRVDTIFVDHRVVSDAADAVRLTRNGNSAPVAPGTTLEPGDILTTGPGSQTVLLLENGSVEVVVLENTEVRISSIWVQLGEVFVRVKGKLRETFEVESEYGIAGVEGTEFMVRVQPAAPGGETYHCVTLEGQVSVRSSKGTWAPVMVRSREAFSVGPGAAPMQRTLDRGEFNDLVKRVNNIERLYRPTAMTLVVPDVVGLTDANARGALKEYGLSVNPAVGRITGQAPVGQVLRQIPAAGGRTPPGAAVTLEVEAEPTTVPEVTGMQEAAAEGKLGNARLRKGEVTRQIVGERPTGEVLRQRPTAGETVPVDSAVDLWVEAESVRVPQVVNTDLETGRRMLTEHGLVVGRVTEELALEGIDGTIAQQGIAANAPVTPGTPVDLVVTMRGVEVPGISSRAEASRVLSNAGLRLGQSLSRRSTAEPGAVIDQSPAPGTLARPGASVDIVIEEGCRVPPVTGQSRQAATSSVSAAGLTASVRSVGLYNSDNVSGQEPGPGGPHRCGSIVYLDLGTNIG